MLPDSLLHLIELLSRLPGVGEKTAQRFALHLVAERSGTAQALGEALRELGTRVKSCLLCGNIAEVDHAGKPICVVCRDNRRDAALLCIVAKVQDLLAIERRAHRACDSCSPTAIALDGRRPGSSPSSKLFRGLATMPFARASGYPSLVDCDDCALLHAVDDARVAVSRIASGVPTGRFGIPDQITLGRAIEGRRSLDSR